MVSLLITTGYLKKVLYLSVPKAIFNKNLILSYRIPKGISGYVKIMDISGRCVSTIFNGIGNGELEKIKWGNNQISNGIYFIQLRAGSQRVTKKVIKIR